MSESEKLNQIISRCKERNADGFSQLVDMYAGRCYAYFYRLTGSRDVSDDLLSELFVKLIRKINSYKGGSFESWLFRIASNIFYDYLKGRRRQERLLEGRKNLLRSETTNAKAPDGEIVDQLQSQLKKLDTDTKELIMLRFYSNLSFKQIAEMRHEPIGTASSKVHRGLKKLRELMKL